MKYTKQDVEALNKFMEAAVNVLEKKSFSTYWISLQQCLMAGTTKKPIFSATYATYPSAKVRDGCEARRTLFSSIDDKKDHSASRHIDSITYVLSFFREAFSNVAQFIANSCATNCAMYLRAKGHFIDCWIHHYNLAKKVIMAERKKMVQKVKNITSFLTFSVRREKLRARNSCSFTVRWQKVILDRHFATK